MAKEIRGGESPSPSLWHQYIPPQLQPSAALQLFTWITPVRVGTYRWFTTVVCPNILSCTPLTHLTLKSSHRARVCAGRFTLTHDTQVSAALCSIMHYVSVLSPHLDINTCIKAQICTRVYLWKPLYQQALGFLRSVLLLSWIQNVTAAQMSSADGTDHFNKTIFQKLLIFHRKWHEWSDYIYYTWTCP